MIGGGVILAVFGLLAKAIGALYRLPLTNILGAEGLGAYQMAYPVFALVVAATSSAIPVLVARSLPTIENFEVRTSFFNSTLKYALVVGISFGALLAATAKVLANLQGSDIAEYGYYALAPAVVFVALLAAFRGFFNSRLETMLTSISGLIEQIVKLSGVALAYFFARKGAAYSLFSALLGVTLSEAVACAFAFFAYLKKNGLPRSLVKIPVKAVAYGILPLAVGSLIFPLATFSDSLMTARLLIAAGAGERVAVAEYGILAGSVGVLVNLPVSLAISFVVTALPVIAERKRKRDMEGIKHDQTSSLRAVLLISLPSAIGLGLAAAPLVNVLYGGLSAEEKTLAILLLRLAAIEIPLASLLQLFSAYLQAFDRSVTASRNMLIGAVVKLAANFSALFLGISGIVFSTVLCYSICLALDAYSIYKLVGRVSVGEKISPLCALVSMTVAVYFIIAKIKNNILSTALSVLLGGAVYGIILLIFKAAGKNISRRKERSV